MMQKRKQGAGAAKSVRPPSAHQVRIIGGAWKRTPLTVLDAEGLRPTPDRVRETVFNWLSHLLNGQWQGISCLDLFSGTGALGFEAASRGASQVVMVEQNPQAVRQLESVKGKLKADQVDILRGDALSVARNLAQQPSGRKDNGRGFDVIFLDPPYHQNWLDRILPVCDQLLRENGLLYVESEYPLDAETPPAWLTGWQTVRADKAGQVFYRLLVRNSSAIFQA